MTERRQIWHPMRSAISVYGHFTRIESQTGLGIPDVAYTIRGRSGHANVVRGHSGWIENKLFEREGRAPTHLTLEQVIWAEEEVRAGGAWHLLGRCGPAWLLYDAAGARALLEGDTPLPIFRTTGPFPLKELLHVLARA